MRRPTLTLLVAVVLALVLLIGGYMGAYYAMLKEGWEPRYSGVPHPPTKSADEFAAAVFDFEMAPAYRIDGEIVVSMFWPAHQLDRVIRPKRWSFEAPFGPPGFPSP
jgi:hypothetical protein